MIEARIKVVGKIDRFLCANRDRRFLYLLGGAGAAKSWTIAMHLVTRALEEENVGILITRKTGPAVKASCWPLVKYYLDTIVGKRGYIENKSDLIINLPNGNFIRFDSIDDIEKKKSIEGINYWWAEETTGLTLKEFMRMNLSVRAANRNGINQIFCSFNPVDPAENAWLKNLTDTAPTSDDSAVLRVTHLDNPFLAEAERREIEKLASLDAEYDSIYRLGEWATPTGIIFTNWDIVDTLPEGCSVGYGLDFGFNNPAALVAVGERDQEVWLDELLYETNLTNADLMQRFAAHGLARSAEIVADCAEPKAIEEISRGGWNIHPCVKGEDSVRHGITAMKQRRLHITRRSVHLIAEVRTYKWRVNRSGEVLDEPVKFNDHAIDAARYRISRAPVAKVVPQLIYLGDYGD